jgi:hypothetical protein
VGEPLSADGDMVGGSRLDIFEFKESVAVRHNRAGIRLDRAFENDSRARNGVVVHVNVPTIIPVYGLGTSGNRVDCS